MNPRREKERRPAGEVGKSATVATVRQQQHTGNHPEDEGQPEDGKQRPYGADKFGGTRAGAENVEPTPGRAKPRNR